MKKKYTKIFKIRRNEEVHENIQNSAAAVPSPPLAAPAKINAAGRKKKYQ